MAILLKRDNRVIIQNVHSAYARNMIVQMRDAGTRIVGGVAPGSGGSNYLDMPVFDSVAAAVKETGADTSVIYTPAFAVADAVVEAVDSGIKLAVAAAEHAPVHDVMPALAYARERGSWVIGPNALGLLSPGIGMLCGLPPAFGMPGRVGVISRSGTLSIAMLRALTARGIGQSTAVSFGGDSIIGRRPVEYVREFEKDCDTDAVVVVGEIGGGKEAELADAMNEVSKPVFAMIVGRSAPEGRTLGHAGALARNANETAASKIAQLQAAGVTVCSSPMAIALAVKERLSP